MKKGLVIVNTGNGKGKTTAALGVMLRAWGHGMQTCMIQFIKHEKANFGEHKAAQKIGLEIISTGDGFVRESEDSDESAEFARQGWKIAKEKICSGQYDLVILDEMTYCFEFGWLDFEEIRDWLDKNKPEKMHLVITGRNACQALIDYADLVTEMKAIKHPFNEQGIKAQKGIEF